MNQISTLQTENRKLFMELNKLSPAEPDYEEKYKAVAKKIRENIRDMDAFAAALGGHNQQSRLYSFRK